MSDRLRATGRPAANLAGKRFGRLFVLCRAANYADGHAAWICLCDCGKPKVVASNSLVRKNPSQSCGCMNATVAQRRTRPGGAWNEAKSYAILNGEHCYRTRRGWAKAVIRHYGNRCERCGWGAAKCDAHHRIRKSMGGLHTIANGVVLCPNCHRIEHENS